MCVCVCVGVNVCAIVCISEFVCVYLFCLHVTLFFVCVCVWVCFFCTYMRVVGKLRGEKENWRKREIVCA